jgi:hypothetical protein
MNSEQTQSRAQDDRHSETVLATVRGAIEKDRVDSILTHYGLRAESADGSDRIAVMSGNRHSEPEVDLDLVELALEKLGDAHRDGSLSNFDVVDSKLQQI